MENDIYRKKEILAKYKCLKCGKKWKEKPKPTQCRKCGHDYVKWLNYEEMRKEWNKDGYIC